VTIRRKWRVVNWIFSEMGCRSLSSSFKVLFVFPPKISLFFSFGPLWKRARFPVPFSLSLSLFQTPILKWNLCKRELEHWSIMNNSVIEEYTHTTTYVRVCHVKKCVLFSRRCEMTTTTQRRLDHYHHHHNCILSIYLSIHPLHSQSFLSPLSWHNTIPIFSVVVFHFICCFLNSVFFPFLTGMYVCIFLWLYFSSVWWRVVLYFLMGCH